MTVGKGSPGSGLMALFMDKKKCHFQCNSISISGILRGPNGNLWRRDKVFAICSQLSSLKKPRMVRMFFFLVCGCCIPLPSNSSRKWWVFCENCPRATKGVSALCSEAYSDTSPVLSSVLPVILHYALPKVSQSSFHSLSPCLRLLG